MEDYSKITNDIEKLKELKKQLNDNSNPNFLVGNEHLGELKLPDLSKPPVETVENFHLNDDILKDLELPHLDTKDIDTHSIKR